MKQILIVLTILIIIFSCLSREDETLSDINSNENLGINLIKIWESGDTSAVNEIFSDSCEYVDIPNNHIFQGHQGVKKYISHVHNWGANIKMEIRNKKFNKDFGYIEWTFSAIQSSPIKGRVLIATDKEIKINGLTLIETENNLITKATDYLDALGFVIQLGSKIELPGGVIIGGKN